MSTKPPIFISAVTKELKSARDLVRRTLSFLHFEPVIQEEFGTTTGITKDMLEKKIEPCVALIQIVGQRHGLEVPDPKHPGHCMSFTEYEASFAQQKGKKVWYLVLDEAYPPDELNDEDSDKKSLQRAYWIKARRSNHLYHGIKDAKDLELAVLKMLFELDELRSLESRWIKGGAAASEKSAEASGHTALTKEDIRQAMSEFVAEQQQAKQSVSESDQTMSEDAIYERLGKQLGVSAKEMRSKVLSAARRIKEDKKEPLIERARAAFAAKDYLNCEKLALQAATRATKTKPHLKGEEFKALELAGKAAQAQSHYARALKHYRAAGILTDEKLDPLQWACAQWGIAIVLSAIGQYSEAETIRRQINSAYQRVLGAEHPDTLGNRNNLAESMRQQGKYGEAEQEQRELVKIMVRVLGAEHPYTLLSRNNLAVAIQAQGKDAEVEEEFRAVLEAREQVLGNEHFDTLNTRNNLANALNNQGKHAEAEQEHSAVLAIRERVQGAEHPDVFHSCHNLALSLEAQGRLEEALALTQRAEKGLVKALGVGHPDVKLAKQGRERLEEAMKKG